MISVLKGSASDVHALSSQIPEFSNLYPISEFEKRLSNESLILIAKSNDVRVGFKCGYPKDSSTFYSWMGGVLPSHRKLGVAQLLLYEMEEKCTKRGFKTLEFKTLNEHAGMMIFALKNQFEIVDIVASAKDSRKRIVLQKSLTK